MILTLIFYRLQLSNTTNRSLMNGFHHQHFGAEYEPVITFVDSPPNSEESWPGRFQGAQRNCLDNL